MKARENSVKSIKHAVIYVPGLGDHKLGGRGRLLKTWRFKGVHIELCPMHWTVHEPWEEKLSWLIERIDQRHAEGKTVSIIGESAGASAVINAVWLRSDKLTTAILLCGKSQYPERVAPQLYRRNPAFREALTDSHAIVPRLTKSQKAKLLNLHPVFDLTVPVWETRITGVRNSTFPFILHATGIIFAMTVWKWWIVRYIKKQAKGATV